MLRKTKFKISIIIPCHNESKCLLGTYDNLLAVLKSTKQKYEILLINDGSTDNTLFLMMDLFEKDKGVKVFDLSRNFGKEAALTCGLDYASGDIVIPIDADFQDPPELIPQMISLWHEGYDVVLAKRNIREGESFFKKTTAKIFYKIFAKLSKTPLPENTGDFRLMDQRVVKAIRLLKEKNRFMKGLFAWAGFKTTTINFIRPRRKYGQSSWNYKKLIDFALDGIFSFSTLPLKIWLHIGVLISFASLLYACFLFFRTIVYGTDLPGYASIMVSVLFMGGVQLISLGVIGEYIARIYKEAKDRPIYLINEVYDKRQKKDKA